MHFLTSIVAAGTFLSNIAAAQQYVGDPFANSLPSVPGSELTYFKIAGVMDSNKNNPANLSLANYYSHGRNGKRLDDSKLQRAVVIIHGLQRDPGTYESNMLSALSQVTTDPNINPDTVAVMAPYFPNGDDKNTGYPWTDGLKSGRGSTSSALVWKGSQWSAGGDNQYPYYSQATSSYTVMDQIIQYFDDRSKFPNMKQIVIAGHSLGAQMVQRYAAVGKQLNTQSPVTYWVGNPNSYVWLSTERPLSTASCPIYDDYREGFSKYVEYPMTYGVDLVAQGREAILANYNSKQIAYGRGLQDFGDHSSDCAAGTSGRDRNERFFNFIKAFPPSCDDPSGSNCDTVDFVNIGHDGGGMMASAAGQARLFKDNFYGNGNRSYDFGYPREQGGDDPYPDPSLSDSTAPTNGNTYAGNMTYAGCYSDSPSSRTLKKQVYANDQNTIELCTSTCNEQGFSIAGMEFGNQCMCGNALTSQATKVVESSCNSVCPGNSSQACGGGDRLSIFSNGKPTTLAPPGTPDTIGSFAYSNCYTEGPTGTRALAGKSTSGSFMTLEYCANFCSGYKYFGTEYASECYCGNSINSGASVASKSDCSMTCAADDLEFCGAGNRLTVYSNPDATVPTGTTTSPGSTPTGTGPSCPASDGKTFVSNGLNFTVECGIDHAGGDLTSLSVSSFQGCIDACSSNSKCVDVALSGSACYLKSSLGAAIQNGGIWGAKLNSGASSSSSSSAATTFTTASSTGSSTGGSAGSTTTGTTSATTSTASSTSTSLSCPTSDGTVYTGSSGQKFLVECGIDHAGGDMSSRSVSSFQQCVDACDSTSGCVDVSLSGSACYLKSNLGAALNRPGIWGAKIITSGSSTPSTAVNNVQTSSGASSASSTASGTTSATSTRTSATPSAISCPGSNSTTYTAPSGSTYMIECGIDHFAGDLTSKNVNSFAACIDACDSTPKCLDVSLSGAACYMKSSLGTAVPAASVWGARLVNGTAAAAAA